jgi:hypothetical protein
MDALNQVISQNQSAMQLTDLETGTVTAVDPLEITKDVHQQALRQEVLYLTESVVEKKIPVLEHNHYAINLGHTHTCPDGTTSEALTGRYLTEAYSLVSEGFDSTEQAQDIVCWEHGEKLPIEDGFIILNRKLEVGDKVLLLSVAHGQKYIILSRIFEHK